MAQTSLSVLFWVKPKCFQWLSLIYFVHSPLCDVYRRELCCALAVRCDTFGREISKLCKKKLHFSNFRFITGGYSFVKINVALHGDLGGLGCESLGIRKEQRANTEAVEQSIRSSASICNLVSSCPELLQCDHQWSVGRTIKQIPTLLTNTEFNP